MKHYRIVCLFLLLLLLLSGCGTSLQFVRNSQADYPSRVSPSQVKVYYSEPDVGYDSIGLINWDYYQPGFRSPSITDVVAKLQQKAAKEGGDALIIRKQEIPPLTERNLRIIAEVIRFRD